MLFIAQANTDLVNAVTSLDSNSIASLAGVMGATTIIVSTFIKPYVSNIKGLKDIPILFYTVAVSLGLVVLANKGMHTLQSDNLLQTMFQAFMGALGAAGAYHLPGATQSVEATQSPEMVKVDVQKVLAAATPLIPVATVETPVVTEAKPITAEVAAK